VVFQNSFAQKSCKVQIVSKGKKYFGFFFVKKASAKDNL
jgi:hypothetical protein